MNEKCYSGTKNTFLRIAASVCVAMAAPLTAFADIYKCPGAIYANTSVDLGPAELEAKGCQRLSLSTDPISTSGDQQITIKISADGHFWVNGMINGRRLKFLVDTGATSVSVSEHFAAAANLLHGRPVRVSTASGEQSARLIDGVAVTASIFTVPQVEVLAGLTGLKPDEGLLGQSFLSNFEVTLDERQMVIRNKKK